MRDPQTSNSRWRIWFRALITRSILKLNLKKLRQTTDLEQRKHSVAVMLLTSF
jgi:hypothetical protein